MSQYKVELRFWWELNSEVSRGTNSDWDFCLIWICSWLKIPQHSGFRLPSNSAFLVSSSTERAVLLLLTRSCRRGPSGYFSRTQLKCSLTVVNTPLYCTRKWSCNSSCTSALSLLQLPCNGSTGHVCLPEHETFWRNTWYMNQVFREKSRVPGGGPDQLNRYKEAAAGSMLTCSSNCSFISWYKTMGCLPPLSCTWVTFCKNSHSDFVFLIDSIHGARAHQGRSMPVGCNNGIGSTKTFNF